MLFKSPRQRFKNRKITDPLRIFNIPEEVKYLAMDKRGIWYGYEKQPVLSEEDLTWDDSGDTIYPFGSGSTEFRPKSLLYSRNEDGNFVPDEKYWAYNSI